MDSGSGGSPALGRLVLAVLVVLASRRRSSAGAAAPPEDHGLAPAVQAVHGRTSRTELTPSRALQRDGRLLPGRPRLAPVLGGSLRHADDELPDELPLPVGEHVVGRALDADLRIAHPTVSPRHVLLRVEPDGRVRVRDLGTVNGVLVDGVPVVEAQLHDGNRLGLGEAQLVFRADPQTDDGGRQGGEKGEQPHQRAEGRD